MNRQLVAVPNHRAATVGRAGLTAHRPDTAARLLR